MWKVVSNDFLQGFENMNLHFLWVSILPFYWTLVSFYLSPDSVYPKLRVKLIDRFVEVFPNFLCFFEDRRRILVEFWTMGVIFFDTLRNFLDGLVAP